MCMANETSIANSHEVSNGDSCHLLSTPHIGLKREDLSLVQKSAKPFVCNVNKDPCLEYFLILRKDGSEVEAVWSYPQPFYDVLAKYPNLTQFVYVSSGTSYSVDDLSHTFVLTNNQGIRAYGHCTSFVNGEAVVSLSPYPWCRFFFGIASFVRVNGHERGKELIRALYRSPTPPSGGCFQIPGVTSVIFRRPYDRLCSFIDTSPLDLLSIFPDTSMLFSILADLLLEKHIIVVGPNFGLVSNVVMSLQTLISPFDWMHILIPILPTSLLDVLGAPPPYLVGLLTSQLSMIGRIPIDRCVMIHLGSSGKCKEVLYHNEVQHNLPHSGWLSALRIGYSTLKLRDPRDRTVRDLCSLFMTYYASFLGYIGLSGAKGFIRSRSCVQDISFYDLLLSTQCFNTLSEAVCEALADKNHGWMDNEFIVALVRGHSQVYPDHYTHLINEENKGGGYAARYKNVFGSREEFTALSAAVHGFGGHRMDLCKLLSNCFFGCVIREADEEDGRTAVTIDDVGISISRRKYLSAPLDTPMFELGEKLPENSKSNGNSQK